MEKATRQMFKTLTELQAAPGDERRVRDYMSQELGKYADHLISDNLGSVFGEKIGDGPRVMVAGHMDEVGFMVTQITGNGMIRFQTLGGWWSQVMLAQRVQVMTKQGAIPGVIASTPPHLLTPEQRQKPVDTKEMLIDIGADDKEDAETIGVTPGDSIVPICPFTPMTNEKKILAKAWDNRYGCGLSIELLKELQGQTIPNHLFSGATVQEEVGLRGAQSAAHLIQPDLFFALDASPANDTAGDKNEFGQLGEGALLRIFDKTMITHPGIREFILDTAKTHDIPYQYYVSQGGTDAGRVHTAQSGIPSAVIGICSRYIHTAASMIHVDDYAAAKELIVHLVKNTDQSTVDSIRKQ
ncbi:MAG TPA: M42 family metallopeptidase [Pseudogracilibacillus sp.]|nr:M42 family metallopeptidase [Pseudogracilibacillus sp.]